MLAREETLTILKQSARDLKDKEDQQAMLHPEPRRTILHIGLESNYDCVTYNNEGDYGLESVTFNESKRTRWRLILEKVSNRGCVF
mmetsp:Transcript_107727/g.170070  ORF Transcript_107727/g.170070 Transcript_107727/m.170070 type:complete len:86 (+) Transcript_107727:1276-1533(+)